MVAKFVSCLREREKSTNTCTAVITVCTNILTESILVPETGGKIEKSVKIRAVWDMSMDLLLRRPTHRKTRLKE